MLRNCNFFDELAQGCISELKWCIVSETKCLCHTKPNKTSEVTTFQFPKTIFNNLNVNLKTKTGKISSLKEKKEF